MFATERQRAILHRARTGGRVDVLHLAGELEVTPETIRRDLTSLERRMAEVALDELPDEGNITLHVLGGRTCGRTLATVDAWAERALGEIFVDVAFLGADGVCLAHGLTASDVAEATTKRAMIGAARRTVILADHTTFEADAFARFGELADVDVIVTDSALDPDLASDVESAGPRVVRA